MQTPPSHKLSFALICALVGFPQLSETIYTPSLPSIVEGLATSAHLVEWTLSVYFIGFALGVGCWGVLADKIGRRPVMLIGILIYCLSTLVCWQAQGITILLMARVMQAVGASVGSVITQTMLRDVLTGKERSQWFALIGIPLSLAPAIGPLLGGWLDYLFNWRANFVALFLIGFVLLLVCFKKLPETKPALISPSPSGSVGSLFLQIITDQKVMGSAFLVAGINGILFSFYAEAPFLLMEQIGLTANQYGWVGLSIALAGLIGSLTAHRLLQYFSHETLIGSGCSMMLLGCAGMVTLAHVGLLTSNTMWLGTGLLLLMMFIAMLGGMGLAIPNLLSMALTNYQSKIGRAGSIFGLIYYFLIALLTAGMAWLHDGSVLMMPWYFLGLSLAMSLIFYWMLYRPSQQMRMATSS